MTTHNTTTNSGTHASEKPNKKRLILSGLTEKQRARLTNGSVGLLGLLGGAGLFSMVGSTTVEDNPTEDIPTDDNANEEVLVVDTDATFAQGNFDRMSFGDAFAAARDQVGAGGFFEWRGASYNTYSAEEWNAMSSAQKKDFATNLYNNSDFENAQIVKRTEILKTKDNYDLNNDGNIDVTMEDLDGDGVKEIHEIDLDSDGHIDIIHDATVPESSNTQDQVEGLENQDNNVRIIIEIDGVKQEAVTLDDSAVINDPLNDIGSESFVIAEELNDGEYAETVVLNPETATEAIFEGEELEMYIIDEGVDLIDIDDLELVEDELNMDDFLIVDDKVEEASQNVTEIDDAVIDVDDFDIDKIDF